MYIYIFLQKQHNDFQTVVLLRLIGCPSKQAALSRMSLPVASWLPPGRKSLASSLRVMATRLDVMCPLLMLCCQACLATPSTTTRDKRGSKTSTSTVVGGAPQDKDVALCVGDAVQSVCAALNGAEKVRVVSEKRLSVTSFSPHIQQSSVWGSMAAPLSGR